MHIQQEEQNGKGKFFINTGNEISAEIDYSLLPGILIINHTEVDDKLRGQNIGYFLVNHTADYAREKNLKIIPICPFAKAIFEKRIEEYKDVLKSQA